jgi:hypothetical protein
MIYIEPTKRGIGITVWGTQDDLNTLYAIVGKFWGEDQTPNIPGNENRNKLLGWFSYDLRKAYEGQRLKRNTSPDGFDTATYFGNQFTWVHFLFGSPINPI